MAVSGNASRWLLLNASPDIRTQFSSFPDLLPKGLDRVSAIHSVLLTDAELDHVAGLLSLRETQPMHVRCTAKVYDWVFASNPIFSALVQSGKLCWSNIESSKREACRETSLSYEAVFVDGKVPAYVKTPCDSVAGATVAYRIIDANTESSILYVPVIKQISEELVEVAAGCDCILFDGSFWSENEMERRGVGTRTASAMGHVPISGSDGSMARLSHLSVRKIYTHVNNTNPVLDEGSDERRAIEGAGWEVAEDGMDFSL